MDELARRLLRSGVVLILLSLFIGLVIPGLTVPRLGVAAHVNGVVGGLALIVLGLLWPLRPGGTFLFNIWNEIEHNEFAAVVTDAVGKLYPEDPPLFLARTPHGHGCPTEIEADVSAAGFKKCELFQLDNISVASTADVPAIAYCQGTPLRNEIEAREPGGLRRATEAAAEAIRARYGPGPVEGRISAVVVSAG